MGWLSSVFWAFWYILPAYVANASPVILGGGRPIDGGRYWRDGRRILGDGKTWRGFIGGVAAGTLVGVIQYLITPDFYGSLGTAVKLAFLLSFGALVGDRGELLQEEGQFTARCSGNRPRPARLPDKRPSLRLSRQDPL